MAITSNHAKAISFIRTAASQGAHLAVLPEYHLTNWLPEDPNFISLCAQSQTYLDAYCALAEELSICIVPGTIVEQHGDELHNVAYFIDNQGEILAQYQKKNLWHPERPHLTSSKHDPHFAFDTPLGKVGMLICWDLAFPEAFRELIAGGAKMSKYSPESFFACVVELSPSYLSKTIFVRTQNSPDSYTLPPFLFN
jgi:predicted amidohydrolase